MADDAAGAVRRTPRPAPEMRVGMHGDVWTVAIADRFGWTMAGTGDPLADLTVNDWTPIAPVPTVMPGESSGEIKRGTVIDWVKHLVADYKAEVGSPPPPDIVAHITVAVLREMGWERRPVVLLRAEDCDCTPPYADCKHGPEPVDALDLAVWLAAEARWQRDDTRNQFLDHYRGASGQLDRIVALEAALRERTAERDGLQARLDAALALTEPHPLCHWDTQWPIRAALEGVTADEYAGEQDSRTASSGPTAQGIPAESESTMERLDVSDVRRTWAPGMDPLVVHVEHVPRAALQGDQPTEPVKRCCIGPFADGSHAVNCWQRCQDCGDDETTCRCRDGDQPTGEADRG